MPSGGAMRRSAHLTCLCGIPLIALSLCAQIPAKTVVDFSRDVAPILEKHCIRCHEPGNKKSGLSLATFSDLRENDYVSPGHPENSDLIDVVSAGGGEKPMMPK